MSSPRSRLFTKTLAFFSVRKIVVKVAGTIMGTEREKFINNTGVKKQGHVKKVIKSVKLKKDFNRKLTSCTHYYI